MGGWEREVAVETETEVCPMVQGKVGAGVLTLDVWVWVRLGECGCHCRWHRWLPDPGTDACRRSRSVR